MSSEINRTPATPENFIKDAVRPENQPEKEPMFTRPHPMRYIRTLWRDYTRMRGFKNECKNLTADDAKAQLLLQKIAASEMEVKDFAKVRPSILIEASKIISTMSSATQKGFTPTQIQTLTSAIADSKININKAIKQAGKWYTSSPTEKQLALAKLSLANSKLETDTNEKWMAYAQNKGIEYAPNEFRFTPYDQQDLKKQLVNYLCHQRTWERPDIDTILIIAIAQGLKPGAIEKELQSLTPLPEIGIVKERFDELQKKINEPDVLVNYFVEKQYENKFNDDYYDKDFSKFDLISMGKIYAHPKIDYIDQIEDRLRKKFMAESAENQQIAIAGYLKIAEELGTGSTGGARLKELATSLQTLSTGDIQSIIKIYTDPSSQKKRYVLDFIADKFDALEPEPRRQLIESLRKEENALLQNDPDDLRGNRLREIGRHLSKRKVS